MPDYYHLILNLARELLSGNETRIITAADTGDTDFPPTQTIMRRAEFPVDGGSIEVNLTETGVRPPYHWLVEISLRGQLFGHFILTVENVIEETYGKKVFTVEPEAAAKLYDQLKDLQ